MTSISRELDCAKAILKTYHLVHDTPKGRPLITRPKKQKNAQKNRESELENELSSIKTKYSELQHTLSDRDEQLARLHRQLIERSNHMERLQEDFENAIYQLQKRTE